MKKFFLFIAIFVIGNYSVAQTEPQTYYIRVNPHIRASFVYIEDNSTEIHYWADLAAVSNDLSGNCKLMNDLDASNVHYSVSKCGAKPKDNAVVFIFYKLNINFKKNIYEKTF